MDIRQLLDAAKFLPEHLSFPDAWIGHIPFGTWLMEQVEPAIFVELGTHSGNSFLAFCQAIKENNLQTRCYAVDTWKGDEHAGSYGEEVFESLASYHEAHYSAFSRLLRLTFDDAVSYFADGSIDLIHIDGLHTYEAVKHDFETWLPKLSPHAVVIFHDTNVRERGFGIWQFWLELCQKYPLNFEFIHSHGLGVIQLSEGKGEENLSWLNHEDGNRMLIRQYFAALGARTLDQYHRLESEGLLAQTRAKLLQVNSEHMQTVQENEQQIAALKEQVTTLTSRLSVLKEQSDTLTDRISGHLHATLDELTALKERNTQCEMELHYRNATLNEIYTSNVWKFVQRIVRLRLSILPRGSAREKFVLRIFHFPRLITETLRGEQNPARLSEVQPQPQLEQRELGNPLPRVSIIIPVYNVLHMTMACINSLYQFTNDVDFEVIVIDNASEDETYSWLTTRKKNLANLTVKRLEKNIGFGPAVNLGLQSAKGKYVVILNNDTLLSPGWLTNLISAMEKDPSIGVVSPMTNYVGEGPQIDHQAQMVEPSLGSVADYALSISNRSGVYYEPNRLVFFCVLLRREVVDFVGYLDEGYQKGNYEDDDYCLRVRMAGYRLAIAQNAFVYHHGTTTFKLNNISHEDWMERNRVRFYQKAGRVATSHRSWETHSIPINLSVIVRTKNRPGLLKKALISLANQTYRDFEVVLVNDGGEDIQEIVNYFTSIYPITYIHHQNSKGRTAAINAGLQNAKGEWIAYLDDDDIVYPWHYESLMRGAEESGAQVVYGNFNHALLLTNEDSMPDRIVGISPWGYDRNELLITNRMAIHTYIHRRSLVEITGPWNEELDRLEDYDFLLRLSAICEFHHVGKFTCEYRFHLDTVNTAFAERSEFLNALTNIYSRYPTTDEFVSAERNKVINGLMEQMVRIDELMKNAEVNKTDPLSIRREILRMVAGF